jgi:hypothetical protein
MQPRNIREGARRLRFILGGATFMAQSVGTIILVILALIVAAAVLNFVLGLLGIVFALIPLLIKLAIIGGLLYFGWMAVRKLMHSTQS